MGLLRDPWWGDPSNEFKSRLMRSIYLEVDNKVHIKIKGLHMPYPLLESLSRIYQEGRGRISKKLIR